MATKLGIFNAALAELGARDLQSLTEPVESRRVLARLWDANFAKRCLETGLWNFALRTVRAEDDPPAPVFGYAYRIQKPSDWIRTAKISAYDTFLPLLNDYTDEGGYWYLNFDTIYVQYVSNHPSFGGNLDRWPESFTEYVERKLALAAAPRLIASKQELTAVLRGPDGLNARVRQALENAKSKDSSNQPPEKFPYGTWVRSRSQDYYIPNDRDE